MSGDNQNDTRPNDRPKVVNGENVVNPLKIKCSNDVNIIMEKDSTGIQKEKGGKMENCYTITDIQSEENGDSHDTYDSYNHHHSDQQNVDSGDDQKLMNVSAISVTSGSQTDSVPHSICSSYKTSPKKPLTLSPRSTSGSGTPPSITSNSSFRITQEASIILDAYLQIVMERQKLGTVASGTVSDAPILKKKLNSLPEGTSLKVLKGSLLKDGTKTDFGSSAGGSSLRIDDLSSTHPTTATTMPAVDMVTFQATSMAKDDIGENYRKHGTKSAGDDPSLIRRVTLPSVTITDAQDAVNSPSLLKKFTSVIPTNATAIKPPKTATLLPTVSSRIATRRRASPRFLQALNQTVLNKIDDSNEYATDNIRVYSESMEDGQRARGDGGTIIGSGVSSRDGYDTDSDTSDNERRKNTITGSSQPSSSQLDVNMAALDDVKTPSLLDPETGKPRAKKSAWKRSLERFRQSFKRSLSHQKSKPSVINTVTLHVGDHRKTDDGYSPSSGSSKVRSEGKKRLYSQLVQSNNRRSDVQKSKNKQQELTGVTNDDRDSPSRKFWSTLKRGSASFTHGSMGKNKGTTSVGIRNIWARESKEANAITEGDEMLPEDSRNERLSGEDDFLRSSMRSVGSSISSPSVKRTKSDAGISISNVSPFPVISSSDKKFEDSVDGARKSSSFDNRHSGGIVNLKKDKMADDFFSTNRHIQLHSGSVLDGSRGKNEDISKPTTTDMMVPQLTPPRDSPQRRTDNDIQLFQFARTYSEGIRGSTVGDSLVSAVGHSVPSSLTLEKGGEEPRQDDGKKGVIITSDEESRNLIRSLTTDDFPNEDTVLMSSTTSSSRSATDSTKSEQISPPSELHTGCSQDVEMLFIDDELSNSLGERFRGGSRRGREREKKNNKEKIHRYRDSFAAGPSSSSERVASGTQPPSGYIKPANTPTENQERWLYQLGNGRGEASVQTLSQALVDAQEEGRNADRNEIPSSESSSGENKPFSPSVASSSAAISQPQEFNPITRRIAQYLADVGDQYHIQAQTPGSPTQYVDSILNVLNQDENTRKHSSLYNITGDGAPPGVIHDIVGPDGRPAAYDQYSEQILDPFYRDYYNNINRQQTPLHSQKLIEDAPSTSKLSLLPSLIQTYIINNSSYEGFRQLFDTIFQQEHPNIQQLAVLFQTVSLIYRLSGSTSTLATTVRDYTLRFFQERFADFIDSLGGWNRLDSSQSSDYDVD